MRIVHTVTFKAKFKWCIFYHYKVISLILMDCMAKWIRHLTSDGQIVGSSPVTICFFSYTKYKYSKKVQIHIEETFLFKCFLTPSNNYELSFLFRLSSYSSGFQHTLNDLYSKKVKKNAFCSTTVINLYIFLKDFVY